MLGFLFCPLDLVIQGFHELLSLYLPFCFLHLPDLLAQLDGILCSNATINLIGLSGLSQLISCVLCF